MNILQTIMIYLGCYFSIFFLRTIYETAVYKGIIVKKRDVIIDLFLAVVLLILIV